MKKKLVENYKYMDTDFEQNYYSRTAKGNYRIVHDNIRLIKWMVYREQCYKKGKILRFKAKCFINFYMNHLNRDFYEEVKDKKCIIFSSENLILGERKESKKLVTQCQDNNDTQTGKIKNLLIKNIMS